MDMMQVRKMVMAQMAQNTWKLKSITAPESYSRADHVKTWLESVLPTNTQYAVIIRDNQDYSQAPNNELYSISVIGGNFSFWIRYQSSSSTFISGTSFGGGTGIVVSQGEQFTIFYQ